MIEPPWRPALTVFADPMTTRTENGVGCLAPFTTKWRTTPNGRVLNLSKTVFGFSRTLVAEVSPPESVAVSCSSSQHGYWWSGALNDPLGDGHDQDREAPEPG